MRQGDAPDRVVIAPKDRRKALVDIVGDARRRLLISVFRCDDRRVIEALADACQRGVRVEAILTRRSKDPKSSRRLLRLLLEQLGVRVWRSADRRMKYHCKYVVADGQRALVGSANLTRRCFSRTSDFVAATRDPSVVGLLTDIFEYDSGQTQARPDLTRSPRLIVGPDQARPRFAALLAEARRSIRIIDPKLTDPAMQELLRRRADAGVAVSLLQDRHVGELVSHGKLTIIDERLAVVGSMALAARDLEARREVALIVEERRAVTELVRFFEEHAANAGRGQAANLPVEAVA